MITRMWRGWARSDHADRYEQHYRSEVLATLRQVPGFRGARLLRRTLGAETEFVSLTLFDDLDAIRSVAGPDDQTAVVAGKPARCSSGSMSGSPTTRPRSKPKGCWWTDEDGSARQVVEVVADELGPSLRSATATTTRTTRSQ